MSGLINSILGSDAVPSSGGEGQSRGVVVGSLLAIAAVATGALVIYGVSRFFGGTNWDEVKRRTLSLNIRGGAVDGQLERTMEKDEDGQLLDDVKIRIAVKGLVGPGIGQAAHLIHLIDQIPELQVQEGSESEVLVTAAAADVDLQELMDGLCERGWTHPETEGATVIPPIPPSGLVVESCVRDIREAIAVLKVNREVE